MTIPIYRNHHKCPQNTTANEVWAEASWGYNALTMPPTLTLVGDSPTSHFEHSERIMFCPYCGADLSIATGCGVDFSRADG